MKTDVIVVGGGLGGLASAIWLRRAGYQVVLFERSKELGGRARSSQHHEAWFNLGPHALYPGRARELLIALGLHPKGGSPPRVGSCALKAGKLFAMPSGPVSLLSTGLFSLTDRFDFIRWAMSLGRTISSEHWNWTVDEYLDRSCERPGVRQLAAALIRLTSYAHAPDLLSAGAALSQLEVGLRKAGVMYLDGGWRQLVDGLRSIAVAEGVDIRVGRRVQAVVTDERATRGVQVDDERWESVAVILALGDPAQVSQLVNNGAHDGLSSAAKTAVPARAAALDLLLHQLPRPRARFALGLDQPLYFSLHSDIADVAPANTVAFHAARYLAPNEDGSKALGEIEAGLDVVQPGWRQQVIERRFVPELTVCAAIPLATKGGFAGRPGVEVSDRPGLFIAGDWVGTEGMLLDASMISAQRAAQSCQQWMNHAAQHAPRRDLRVHAG